MEMAPEGRGVIFVEGKGKGVVLRGEVFQIVCRKLSVVVKKWHGW